MSKAEYKRLGDFIREVNVRNRELKVTKPMGINIEKYFMPSVANVIGTDLSVYKLVGNKQFACNLMHVGRDGKIPMAMHKGNTPIIVSPAYFVFENQRPKELLSDYLMMWFRRSEFDRKAWFYTDADVRGGMTKEALLDMEVSFPTIERQHEIVTEYETLYNRIRINEQMIKKLEETAQALYRKMFVDNIDKENLPNGWRMGTLTDIATYLNGTAGQKYETKEKEYLPVLKIRELSQGHCDDSSDHVETSIPHEYIINTGDVIFSWSATLLIDVWCGGKCALNQHLFKVSSPKYPKWFYFLWTHYHISAWKQLISAKATSMGHIKREDLESAQVIIPPDNVMGYLNDKMHPIFEMYILIKQENLKLTDLQSLLLAKMGQ